MAWRIRNKTDICGPTQLNIHFEGVSDHEENKILVFFGTFHVLEAVRWQCRHRAEALLKMLAHACGRYGAPNKNFFRSDYHSQPTHGTHAADYILAHALGHSEAPLSREALRHGSSARFQ
jgi:hypothetical protein